MQPAFDPMFTRRRVLSSAGVAGTGLLAGCTGGLPGTGSEFPDGPLKIVNIAGPGGGFDFYGRLVTKHMREYVDVDVTHQNMPGGRGKVATNYIYSQAPKDGSEWMIWNLGTQVGAQVFEDVDFDVRDFSYYAQIVQSIPGIFVGTHTDVETWEEFVEAVQNEELNFGTRGPSSSASVTYIMVGELGGLWEAQKITDNSVPFEDSAGVLAAIKRGEADTIGGSMSSYLQYVRDGTLRPIAIVKPGDRVDSYPDTPTLGELGVENVQQMTNIAGLRRVFVGPPEVPDENVEKLRQLHDQTINDEDLRAEAEQAGRPIVYLDGETTRTRAVETLETYQDRRELFSQLFA